MQGAPTAAAFAAALDALGISAEELLADTEADSPHLELVRRDTTARLRSRLHALGQRERDVLRLRYGLDGSRPKTLREAGAEMGISRERVRQLELRAVMRLKQLL